MTIGEALDLGRTELSSAGIEDGVLEAKTLLSELTGIGRLDFFLKKEEALSAETEQQYRTFLAERKKRIPLQAILGHAAFFGLDFLVSADTLIPRADTEILCEAAVEMLGAGMQVLDLCTGTGCILLSLLHAVSGTAGIGTDISKDAIALAKRNAGRLGLSDRAAFFSGDLFSALPEKTSFDLIVSNPPYIPTGEIGGLMPEVKDFEPARALDGGADGLSFYRRIIAEAPAYLKTGGSLLFEIGYDEGEAVSALLREKGFSDIILKKDYGGNTRVCGGVWPVHS